MLLFDLVLPGPNSNCDEMNARGAAFWEEKADDARAVRDNWLKSMNEWYLASTCCLSKDSPCYKNIVKLWKKYEQFIEYWMEVSKEFWDSLQYDDSVLTEDICNRYKKAMIDLKCIVRQLFKLVDGDDIQTYTKSLYE